MKVAGWHATVQPCTAMPFFAPATAGDGSDCYFKGG